MTISEIAKIGTNESRLDATEAYYQQPNDRAEVVAAIRAAVREGGLETVARSLNLAESELQIAFDRESRQYVVKVLDRDTQEVVRQIPAEDVLSRARFFVQTNERLAAQQAEE
jgi:flagellar protein FlaG